MFCLRLGHVRESSRCEKKKTKIIRTASVQLKAGGFWDSTFYCVLLPLSLFLSDSVHSQSLFFSIFSISRQGTKTLSFSLDDSVVAQACWNPTEGRSKGLDLPQEFDRSRGSVLLKQSVEHILLWPLVTPGSVSLQRASPWKRTNGFLLSSYRSSFSFNLWGNTHPRRETEGTVREQRLLMRTQPTANMPSLVKDGTAPVAAQLLLALLHTWPSASYSSSTPHLVLSTFWCHVQYTECFPKGRGRGRENTRDTRGPHHPRGTCLNLLGVALLIIHS